MLRFFSGLRIGARLSGAFLLVAVIGGAIGAFGVWGLARINEMNDRLYDTELRGISDIKEANINLIYAGRARNGYLAASTDQERQALRKQFGTFVLLDVDEFQRDRLLSDDAPFLQPFEVMLSAPDGKAGASAMAAFETAVETFEARFRTQRVETCVASDDPSARPELLSLNLPLLTLRFAPIYRVTGTDAVYPDLRERLIDNFLDAGLQAGVDAPGVIVANDRDRRSLVWLREQVGDAAIAAAVAQLAGQRRPYVSNVAKALGIAIPSDLALTAADTARARLAALRSLIKKK